jgi:hypothetical protein
MKLLLVLGTLIILGGPLLHANMFHTNNIQEQWREENIPPFDELMISWNGNRPNSGNFLFYVSVKIRDWSPWLLYATWGSDGQSSFNNTSPNAPIKVFQDALEVLEGKKATGFQIKIVPEGNASLDGLHKLHVYTNSDQAKEAVQKMHYSLPAYIQVPGLSQMTLNHIRHMHLCSPTSSTAVTRYLSDKYTIDPLHFAQNVWDKGFDIFGNWVFNVAQAATELGPQWSCWVERLSGFDEIYQRLHQGTPVVVSVRGPLPGSASPYVEGHLIAVIGYDPSQEKVICMDPAFPSDDQTHVNYGLPDFIQAWNRRGRVAYIFGKN